jgi:hypothetical protein
MHPPQFASRDGLGDGEEPGGLKGAHSQHWRLDRRRVSDAAHRSPRGGHPRVRGPEDQPETADTRRQRGVGQALTGNAGAGIAS